MPLLDLINPDHLPALDLTFVRERPALGLGASDSAPRILLLYGSLRERSFSRLAVEEARGSCACSELRRGYSTLPRCHCRIR